ncbi:hypothetical protein L0F63_000637 [Massospora cicadina]|nr:hypothetical protein L0F63_000637 [Massospora cicadina]
MGFQKISMLEYLEPEMYHATLDSLLKECRAELMVRCSERGLSSDGTKQDLAYPYKYCHVGIFATEVSDKQMRPSLEGLEGYPKVLLTLLVAMWSPNPDERPKASYIVYLLKKLMDHLPTSQPNTRPCDFKKSTKINATPPKHSNYLKATNLDFL